MMGPSTVMRGWGLPCWSNVWVERSVHSVIFWISLLPSQWVFSGLKSCLRGGKTCCHAMPVPFSGLSHDSSILVKVRMEMTYWSDGEASINLPGPPSRFSSCVTSSGKPSWPSSSSSLSQVVAQQPNRVSWDWAQYVIALLLALH